MMNYLYGEEIEYEYKLLKPEDYDKLQAFSCNNKKLDFYIQKELIRNGEVDTEDGLPFKVWNKETGEIIGIFSLAASGIIGEIDIFAIDIKYQKIHMDELSKCSEDCDDHFYLGDSIMCEVIKFCREISENKATAKYIVLYADSKARRFYERNLFTDFSEFMKKESNMEINKNDPMYMLLE